MEIPEIIPSYRMTVSPEGIHIEGHRGIEQYGAELISVRTRSKLITLRGRRLKLGSMDKNELVITGVVQDIELTDRGKKL